MRDFRQTLPPVAEIATGPLARRVAWPPTSWLRRRPAGIARRSRRSATARSLR
jgi:hypothetical protein